jgi:hypothetical protein
MGLIESSEKYLIKKHVDSNKKNQQNEKMMNDLDKLLNVDF